MIRAAVLPCVLRVRDSKHGDQTISALQKIGRVELSRFYTHFTPLLIDLSLQEVCFAWVKLIPSGAWLGSGLESVKYYAASLASTVWQELIESSGYD